MKKLNRTCWWCNHKLMAAGHAEIKDQDGNTVWVHKVCVDNAQAEIRKCTATPSVDLPTNIIPDEGGENGH